MTWTDADITTPERALEQIETDAAIVPGERQDILAVLRALAAASRAEGWAEMREAAAKLCDAEVISDPALGATPLSSGERMARSLGRRIRALPAKETP